MNFIETATARVIARVLVLAMLSISVPSALIAETAETLGRVSKIRAGVTSTEAVETRPLLAAEMRELSGKTLRNPYIAGSQKWGINYSGVDLLTGNFSFSATDLSFEGGYGIPIAVTRSYSSNSGDEGPFGKGWSLSADIRTTAGGVLKSGGAPVRSVPVSMIERPVVSPNDPRDPTEWAGWSGHTGGGPMQGIGPQTITEGVIATDASGYEETIQRDVDGVMTTPPWDKNLTETVYEKKELPGGVWQIPVEMTVTTPEGTVYVYEAKGFYEKPGSANGEFEEDTDGVYAYGEYDANPAPAPTPTYILKIASITDRHGNQVLFTYGAGLVSFYTERGLAQENPLVSVLMENGREIEFEWYENRIIEVTDGDRTVEYGYNGYGFLTSVTTPGGKTTEYTYGEPYGEVHTDSDLLVKITDPRGLETHMSYTVDATFIWPYGVSLDGVYCYRIIHPNGNHTYFGAVDVSLPSSETPYWDSPAYDVLWSDWDKAYDEGGAKKLNEGQLNVSASTSAPYFEVFVHDANANTGMNPVHVNGPLSVYRLFNMFTQDLLTESRYIHRSASQASGGLYEARRLDGWHFGAQEVTVTSTYNFRGSPLSREVQEAAWNPSRSVVRTTETEYAYWGAKKCYQQKAVKDNAGRFTYTDYFDTDAAQGKKGQVYKVFNQPFATFSGTSGGGWRASIEVDDEDEFTATFDYDSLGRPTDVWKLRDDSSTYDYVRTRTTYHQYYGGSAHEVYEDYLGADERVTSTDEYDSAGRPLVVTDAAGKVFETTYNADGQVLSVYRTDVNPDKLIVGYTYGSADEENGMPISVTDGIYEYWQEITYHNSGGGIGQVASVSEGDGQSSTPIYSASYAYTASGEREEATYVTPNGTTRWGYYDYVRAGSPDSPKRVFQTLNKLDGSGDRTAEEFHYQFDTSGRLSHAAFAQSPTLGSPSSGQWYTQYDPASSRAIASYEYGPGGHVFNVQHIWQVWDDDPWVLAYDTENVQKSVYQYNATTGLRTQVEYFLESSGWTLDHKQAYGYDSNLDYLTSATYSTSYTGSESWSYDAAGNRTGTGYAYDNLNRMESSPGYVYQNDVLGNRTWRNFGQSGVQRYVWDEVNRLKSVCGTSDGARYEYRADGMRMKKVADLTITWNPGDNENEGSGFYDDNLSVNKPTTRYFYDGQMPMEEDYKVLGGFGSPTVTVTQYGLGARGIDWIRNKVGSDPETIVFPIYDGHGNMIYTLKRDGTDDYLLGNKRIYGAWGDLRHDSNPGDGPNTQYVGNLGHKKDNESGLTYMRARYYEPWTGRFISEDPAGDGWNWFVYCGNDPFNFVDYDGNKRIKLSDLEGYKMAAMLLGLSMGAIAVLIASNSKASDKEGLWMAANLALTSVALIGYGGTIGKFGEVLQFSNLAFGALITTLIVGLARTGNIRYGPINLYVMSIAFYGIAVLGFVLWGLEIN